MIRAYLKEEGEKVSEVIFERKETRPE